MENKTIYLATDHAGFKLKEKTKKILKKKYPEYNVKDLGAETYNPDDDYPLFIKKAGEKISENPENLAIIFGGSGQGEAMVANRFKNVRATVYYGGNPKILKLSKEHNNANVLSIGARFVKSINLGKILKIWLSEPFSNKQRHQRRIEQIDGEI
ncbi:ribose-5-phosphate isomerase [Candidatus Campbellbacteria bacterium]|nr:MAG: ribose-5-phosphate isomerase [Candidatus Campbellbacteria bacterium]